MDASVLLWENWQEQVKQLLEGIHGHQTKGLAFIVLGMVLSGSAVLQRVAESLQQHGISEAKMPSIERRLERFVGNSRISVPTIWKLFLAQVLVYFRDKPLMLVLDCTPIDDRACIVYVGLLAHSRVLPLAWCKIRVGNKQGYGLKSGINEVSSTVSKYLWRQRGCSDTWNDQPFT